MLLSPLCWASNDVEIAKNQFAVSHLPCGSPPGSMTSPSEDTFSPDRQDSAHSPWLFTLLLSLSSLLLVKKEGA